MSPTVEVAVMTAPLEVLLLALAYTVFVDSKKRWPWAGWWTRTVYILTFGTPPKEGERR